MRKTYIDHLPRWESGTYKGKINWKESIGYKIKFIYDNINGYIQIVNYDRKYLYIKYLDKPIFKITTDGFKECKIGKLLGIYTSDFKIKIGRVFKDDKRDLVITDRKYIKTNHGKSVVNDKYYKYTCNKCGWTEGWIDESNLLKGIGCSCCANMTVVEGINNIPTTAPWMIPYFQGGYDEAKLYTKCSGKKIYPICPDCGRVKYKCIYISTIYNRHSIGCICSDNKSYPEKFLISTLQQINIDFISEYSPDWAKPKRYDFYIPSLNIIIETNGLQHYENKFKNSRSLEEEQENDRLKKELALYNNIEENKYIVINCSNSKLEFIKQNILNSKLSKMFDLNKINWSRCEEFALSNLVKNICEYWNSGIKSTKKISNITKLNRSTVTDYLKKGSSIGWCNYNPKEELIKSNKKQGSKKGKKIICLETGQEFSSASELERISGKVFGINMCQSSISEVCNGKQNSHKGFTFKYI